MMDGISYFYCDETALARPEYHPAFELTLCWLERHCPKDQKVGLVHGDFRNGNFVVGLVDSFEHLAIGRRACENEIDLLALIE